MKFKPEETQLYHRVDELLWDERDPIGVNSNEAARDEYKSYLTYVFKLLQNEEDQKRIAAHLYHMETVNRGLKGETDAKRWRKNYGN